jgi:hypothetical protein
MLLGLMAYYRIWPSPLAFITVPVFLVFALTTALAVGLWLTVLNVMYRDVRYTIPYLVQFWLFATPVVYPASLVPEPWRAFYGLNPMAGVVEGVVVDEKGKAVAGARVAKDRAPTYVPAGASLVGVAITDSSGAFKLPDVAVGDIELEGFAVDIGRGKVEHVRVDEGRTTSGLKIVLHPVSASPEEGLAPGGVAVTLAEIEGRVMIAAVAPSSEAERAGLLEGDELVSVDAVPATSIATARARLSGPLGADVILIVRRKSGDRSIRIPREPTKR